MYLFVKLYVCCGLVCVLSNDLLLAFFIVSSTGKYFVKHCLYIVHLMYICIHYTLAVHLNDIMFDVMKVSIISR